MIRKTTNEEGKKRVKKSKEKECNSKQTGVTLTEAEENYRFIAEKTTDIIFTQDMDLNFTYVSPSVEKISGYKPDEALELSMDDIMTGESLERARQTFHKYMSLAEEDPGLDIPLMEYEYVRKDGSTFLGEVKVDFLRDSSGNLTGVQGVLRDITERRDIQEALRESEERFRALIENSSDILEVIDSNGILTYASPSVERILGYRPEELTGKPGTEIVHPDDLPAVAEGFEEAFKNPGKPVITVCRCRHKDGTWRVLEGTGTNHLENPAVKGFISNTRDITERKQSEKSLRDSEEKYRTLFENAIEAIYVAQDERIVFANPKTEELYGYSAQELASRPLTSFIHEKDRDMVLERHKKRLSGDETPPDVYPFRIIDREGFIKWVELKVTPFSWNNRPAALCFQADITKRIQAQEERRKLQDQFHAAQKMESLGTLAGGIAHNFNNVLMGIQGRASLMLMDKDGFHPDFEHLRGIEEYVKNAAELTKDLLGFARGGKYQPRPTDLNSLIKEENHMFGSTRKEIRVYEKYENNMSTVEVDRGQMRQVLMNLYVNAWQAMPAGGNLYVQTENVNIDLNHPRPFEITPGRYAKISVTDDGLGMDEATRERIFEPFFTTQEMGKGTGLGLSSVYGIVKNHGGFVTVYSEKGEGTTFNIYLPASDKVVESAKRTYGVPVKGSETVLLVDDEEMIIEVGKDLLNNLGYSVLIAGSGKEAIEVYKKNKDRIDIVVLDMIMPDMGGGETFDRLKEIYPDIKVLLSSGYSITGQAQEIIDRGCSGFIQKPFNLNTLSQKIRETLECK